MKKTTPTKKKLGKPRKSTQKKSATAPAAKDAYPRCLICGHHTFIGRPVIRLLRRPNVTIPDSIKRSAGM